MGWPVAMVSRRKRRGRWAVGWTRTRAPSSDVTTNRVAPSVQCSVFGVSVQHSRVQFFLVSKCSNRATLRATHFTCFNGAYYYSSPFPSPFPLSPFPFPLSHPSPFPPFPFPSMIISNNNGALDGTPLSISSKNDRFDFAKIEQEVYNLPETVDEATANQVKVALEVIEEALRRYGTTALSLSFNGGKDCTVLLHLFAAALHRHLSCSSNPPQSIPTIPAVYITYPNPFPGVESFVDTCVRRYGLNLVRIPGPMKGALQQYINLDKGTGAILVGTRRNDPYSGEDLVWGAGREMYLQMKTVYGNHCINFENLGSSLSISFPEHLTHFIPTDPGWPPFMRIHPIIDWTFAQVWNFLKVLNVPYCELYDLGYVCSQVVIHCFRDGVFCIHLARSSPKPPIFF